MTLLVNTVIWAGLAVLVMYTAAVLYMYLRQRALLYAPSLERPDPAACGVGDMQVVTLRTDDGLALNAWWLPPAHAEAPVALYCHGNAGSMADCAFKVAAYRASGMGVLLFDYRGYGGNAGRPTEQGLYADARSARRFLLEEQGVTEDRLVIHGESLGSGVATQLALEHPPAALVLEAAFISIPAVGKLQYPWLPVHRLTKDRYESLAKIGRIQAPVLVVHGEDDDLVPVDFGRRLHAAAREPKELVLLPGAGHADLFDFGAGERITGWVAETVEGALRARGQPRTPPGTEASGVVQG
ncbi:hypothetical protein C882_2914 [Caenispirillum salinarum AK4]|uniref:Serine aminopeptidase S33 domain-containing protein n=1 Tax=Caenispirillum salinarum AK4 TaxID=1238182 RepID=K9HBQ7_9PROT|nr:alpha/beta hydrolase [Caenispirillum salinarum]EKV26146.1 hypothetical protein C882_2914 [Caenispirillum salinarum AK4]